eukprot:3573249-Pleurochrysis_carterae.AAC.1
MPACHAVRHRCAQAKTRKENIWIVSAPTYLTSEPRHMHMSPRASSNDLLRSYSEVKIAAEGSKEPLSRTWRMDGKPAVSSSSLYFHARKREAGDNEAWSLWSLCPDATQTS